MITLLFCTIYFYYIAISKPCMILSVNCYISETYLFVVANNVGFLKLFGGL